MIARRAFGRGALALLLGSTILLSGCEKGTFGKVLDPVYLKLKAEVETPEGIKSGYSVFEIKTSSPGSLFGGLTGGSISFKGEAVAVDLPNGETLFVLLTKDGGQGSWAAYRINDIKVPKYDGPKPTNQAERQEIDSLKYDRIRASREIFPVSSMPMMVRFKDINDSRSIEKVNSDDLSASFGEGYVLKSLTVQATDEPVTLGIEKKLPEPPYIRSFIYEGKESETLNLYNGKQIDGVITVKSFTKGVSE